MRKLELKDIVGYLPYELKMMIKGNYIVRLDSINQTYNRRLWIGYKKGNNCKDFNHSYLSKLTCIGRGFNLGEVKPILHPILDLTKSIKVEGYNDNKEFIPLVALAKKSGFYSPEYTLKMFKFSPNAIKIDNRYTLEYSEGSFFCFDKYKDEYSPINNVHLFDLLNQWHFDYRNLIEDGLAVDINTINE